jgi:hypothetical protein
MAADANMMMNSGNAADANMMMNSGNAM